MVSFFQYFLSTTEKAIEKNLNLIMSATTYFNNLLKLIIPFTMLIVFGTNFLMAQTTTITNFPYKETFKGTAIPNGWIKPGTTNSATPSTDGLYLTKANKSEFGGVVLNGVNFNSTNGLTISFEYSILDGAKFDNRYGDGLSFFLYDANKSATLGSLGRGLGYSNGDLNNGVDGGYLGVGFDVFGNFKNASDSRNGILTSKFPESTTSAGHLTIRGAMGANRTSGYPVLYTIKTDTTVTSPTAVTAKLDITNGTFVYSSTGLSSSDLFKIRPAALSTAIGDVNYRKVKLTLIPRLGGGFKITVEVTHGNKTTKVLDNFDYPTSIKYTDNSADQNGGSVVTLSTPVPTKLQLGFAASTGSATESHLIRDVEISIPYLPETTEDQISTCSIFPQKSVDLTPFSNDIFYYGSLTATPSSGNSSSIVDYSSFQFSDVDDNPLGSTTPGDKSYTQAGIGTWKYTASTGKVTFLPLNGFVGPAVLYYTAKSKQSADTVTGGPFYQEIYRSAPTKLTVNVVKCGSSVNPQLPSGGIIRSGKN